MLVAKEDHEVLQQSVDGIHHGVVSQVGVESDALLGGEVFGLASAAILVPRMPVDAHALRTITIK